MFIDRNLVAIS